MVIFGVACRHALSGEVQHTVWLQGNHVENVVVGRLTEQLRHRIGAVHRRDIRIVQGASVAPNDKPLMEYVDWYHLERVPRWARFDITVDFLVLTRLCTFCQRPCQASPSRCCDLARYCCNDCQRMDWQRHKLECQRRILGRRVW